MKGNIRRQASTKGKVIDKIRGELLRRHSTATILFHHAVAERLSLGPTDLKCFDLLRERGPISASDLVAITGLTSGAITGVVARLEREGYLYREPDPNDGRRQVLHVAPCRIEGLQQVFEPIRKDATTLLESFTGEQLEAIAEFLGQMGNLVSRHAALLRAEFVLAGTHPGVSGDVKSGTGVASARH